MGVRPGGVLKGVFALYISHHVGMTQKYTAGSCSPQTMKA
jgi:hypothetical protein